jgi:hypothetical protein
LALHGGEIVSTGQLVDVVRGETAPLTAVNTLQRHVSRLRGVQAGRLELLCLQVKRILFEARLPGG